jgi:hypothetical protein
MRRIIQNTLFVLTALQCGLSLEAKDLQSPSNMPSVYVAPSGGFEMNVTAALQKKRVPVQVVETESKAKYLLQMSAIEIHKESGVSKLARCAFAYCIGIEDSGDVSVKMVDRESGQVVWAYQVAKQRAARNRQSMAEAIAKHMRKELFAARD